MVSIPDLVISGSKFGVSSVVEPGPDLLSIGSDVATKYLNDKEKRDADAFATEAETNLRLYGAEALEQSRVESENPENITKIFFEKYKSKRDEIYANAPNDLAREKLDDTFAKLKSVYGQQAIGVQVNENQKYRLSKLDNSIDDIATNVRNGGNYKNANEAFESIFETAQSYTSAADREEMRNKYEGKVKTGRLDFLFESGNVGEVERLIKDKSFNSSLSVEQIDAYRVAIEKYKKENGDNQRVINYLNGVGYIDPKDKGVQKAINNVYKQNLAPEMFSDDINRAGAAYSQTMSLIEKTGVVPDELEGMLRSSYISGKNKDLSFQIIADINSRNPRILEMNGITDKQVTEAIMYNEYKKAGVPEEDLTLFVQNKINPSDKATQELRAEDIKKAKKNNNGLAINKDIEDMYDYEVFGEPDLLEIQGASVNKKEQLKQRYSDIYEQYYLSTGDKYIAESRADAVFKQNHGISQITGDKVIMDYPPENYYSHPAFFGETKTMLGYEREDKNHEWMREQLVSAVSKELNKKVDISDIKVMSDGITVRDIRAMTAPSYQIYVKTDYGYEFINRFRWDLQSALKDKMKSLPEEKRTISIQKKQDKERDIGFQDYRRQPR